MLITTLAVLVAPLLVHGGAVISDPSHPPHHSESGQYGYNDCGTKDSPTSKCQTSYINSLDDFCLFAPPSRAEIGDSEEYEVSWCTKAGHGARLIPKGAFHGAHFVTTSHFVQVTGVGDFTKLNIEKGDEGGELDPHGATGEGNPIGGLLLGEHNGKLIQYTEWTEFISDNEFCIRACFPGPDAARWCQHIYDVMGCYWNMPAQYDSGFDTCAANDPNEPMGVYKLSNGQLSTFYQGQQPTPNAQPVPKSSKCAKVSTIPAAKYAASTHTTSTKHSTSTKHTSTKHSTSTKHTASSKKKTTTANTHKPDSTPHDRVIRRAKHEGEV